MSAAPSWPLISSPALGAPSGTRLPPLPGLNFRTRFGGQKSNFGRKSPELFFRPSKRKRTCGAQKRTRPSQPSYSRTAKARNSLLSQRLAGNCAFPPPRFRAAAPIWGDNSGDSRGKPSNPHTFSCSARVGMPRRTPLAFDPPLRGRNRPSSSRVWIPGLAFARSGIPLR
jgi:hypothetical protein